MPFVSFAQKNYDKKIFLDSLWSETSGDYQYYRIIKDYTVAKTVYQIEDYYKSGQIQMKGLTLNKDKIVKSGEFIYYYENGQQKSIYSYVNSKPFGKFSSWYENGSKKIEGEYIKIDNDPKSEPILKIFQFWDENNTQKVTDGEGVFEEKGKDFFTIGFLKNGLKTGEWKGENKKPNFSFIETYLDGKLVSGESTEENGQKSIYNKITEGPEFSKENYKHFYTYVGKNFKFKNPNQIVNGQIFITFYLERDATVSNVRVNKGLSEELDNEAIRVIKSYKKWGVNKSRGVAKVEFYNIPLSLKLNTHLYQN